MSEVIVSGSEDEFPKGSCQNCGDDLSRFVQAYPSQRCDKCPGCGVYPWWTTGSCKSETKPEILTCRDCGNRFISRVRYTTTVEHCGKKERTKVSRADVWARCGACRETAQALHYEEQAKRARERAVEKRASQSRAIVRNDKKQAKKRSVP
jgi:hypothetical protein